MILSIVYLCILVSYYRHPYYLWQACLRGALRNGLTSCGTSAPIPTDDPSRYEVDFLLPSSRELISTAYPRTSYPPSLPHLSFLFLSCSPRGTFSCHSVDARRWPESCGSSRGRDMQLSAWATRRSIPSPSISASQASESKFFGGENSAYVHC